MKAGSALAMQVQREEYTANLPILRHRCVS